MNGKKVLAKELAKKVTDGDCIGLGTGSTAEEIIRAIGERIKNEKLSITGVSTSLVTTSVASDMGIKVLPLSKALKVNWGFDGADEVSPDNCLIKGRGGALLKEKIIANMIPEWIVGVTEDKLVSKLGEKFLMPVEVVPTATAIVENELLKLGCKEIVVRTGSNFYGPLFTESGNLLFDVKFPEITESLMREVKLLTGVVEHGFFPNTPNLKILLVDKDGKVSYR